MRDLAVLFLHLLATVARLAGPGGARAVVAESVLIKQQLLILNRSRKRSPNLRFAERVVAGSRSCRGGNRSQTSHGPWTRRTAWQNGAFRTADASVVS
jgi:hypothetical protein